jgi:hypothetical protein
VMTCCVLVVLGRLSVMFCAFMRHRTSPWD